MELDASSAAHAVHSDGSTVSELPCTFVEEVGVEEFVESRDLRTEYEFARDFTRRAFAPEHVAVEIVCDPEDGDMSSGTLVFLIQCDLDAKSFRAATHELMRALISQAPRLFQVIAVNTYW
jgi:hypothetical protein